MDAAYWVLHGLAFCGGVAALFFLVRRYLGLAAAVVGAATLALTPMYWNAQYWDYIDGVTLTYLLAGLCFGLPSAVGRRRAVSLAAAGVFFAAAVTTNLFAALVALIYPILYAVRSTGDGSSREGWLALKDFAALLLGAAGLVLALGFYARANGGPFRFLRAADRSHPFWRSWTSKIAGYQWLRARVELLVPVVLIALGLRSLPSDAVCRRFDSRLDPSRRWCSSQLSFTAGSSWPVARFSSTRMLQLLRSLDRADAGFDRRSPRRTGRVDWATQVGVAAAATVAGVFALGLIYRNERRNGPGRLGVESGLRLVWSAQCL